MYDGTGNRKAVLYFHADEAHRIFSGMLALDDNDVLQVSRMREMILKFSNKACMGFIREHDVIQALNNTIGL